MSSADSHGVGPAATPLPSAEQLLQSTPWSTFDLDLMGYADARLLEASGEDEVRERAETVTAWYKIAWKLVYLGMIVVALGIVIGLVGETGDGLAAMHIGLGCFGVALPCWAIAAYARWGLRREIGHSLHYRALLIRSCRFRVRRGILRRPSVVFAGRAVWRPHRGDWLDEAWHRGLEAVCEEATSGMREHPRRFVELSRRRVGIGAPFPAEPRREAPARPRLLAPNSTSTFSANDASSRPRAITYGERRPRATATVGEED